MDGVITYLNTDLDLRSTEDLTSLAAALEAAGLWSMHVTCGDDRLWYASFAMHESFSEPDSNIAAMLAAVEELEPMFRSVWAGCALREFNMGYDCGLEPWAFNHGLSSELLGRMAAAGASLRWTLYPDRDERSPAR